MCGRFTLVQLAAIEHYFPWIDPPEPGAPRYNIAPGQPVLAGVAYGEGGDRFRFEWLLWGLVPPWAKDPSIGNKLINARADTLSQRPAFRNAFRRRRCLIPADGFYEWKTSGKTKTPYYIQLRDRSVFAFAGLHETWHDDKGNQLSTCAIITTEPNELVGEIHDRMPAILRPEDQRQWLGAPESDLATLPAMLDPYPADRMRALEVGRTVNSPRNDSPACIQPAAPTQPGLW